MAEEIKRLHYFDHQFLVEDDFTEEQKYHLDMRRRHNRLLHTFGIAEGLEVEKSGDKQIKITPGTAYDREGQEIVLTDDNATIDLSDPTQYPPGSDIYVTIEYYEEESDPSTATGVTGNTRVTEEPKYEAVTTEPPSDGSVIRLAGFTLESDGKVPGSIGDTFDGGMRQMISATIASEAISTNELGDKAVTMEKLPTPVQDKINAQKGITSINKVKSDVDGNVDLVAGTGIEITPNSTSPEIEIKVVGKIQNIKWITIEFNQNNGNDTSKPFSLPFYPNTILCIGGTNVGRSSSDYHGGGISGYYYKTSANEEQFYYGFSLEYPNYYRHIVFGDQAIAGFCYSRYDEGEDMFINISPDGSSGSPPTYKFNAILPSAAKLQTKFIGKSLLKKQTFTR